MFSLRTRRWPLTGSLNTPVKTFFPCQVTFFGIPTLTDTSVPTDWPMGCADAGCGGLARTPTRASGMVRGRHRVRGALVPSVEWRVVARLPCSVQPRLAQVPVGADLAGRG